MEKTFFRNSSIEFLLLITINRIKEISYRWIRNNLILESPITFFLFLLAFFLLTELHSSTKSAFWALGCLFSSFVFAWLFKFTLSENLALGFIWFGLLELSLFLKLKNSLYFLGALSAFLILTFTRIEAWAFLSMLAIIFGLVQKKTKFNLEKALLQKKAWLLGGFFFVYLVNVFVNNQFYLASLKGLLRSFSPSEGSSALFSASSYLFEIFSLYNILPFLIIGIIGLSYFLLKKKLCDSRARSHHFADLHLSRPSWHLT